MAEPGAAAIGSTAPGHYGAEATGVTIMETPIATAWNVQGDLARPGFVDAVRALGVALPQAPNSISASDAVSALWLGPTSWLLVAGGASPLDDFTANRDAINAAGGALFDLTASRVAWTVAGPLATTVLATGCPLDFHPRAFAAGTCAQSVLWHMNALIVKRDEAPAFTVMVARSLARDAWHALCHAAAQHGYEIAAATAYR